MIQQIIYCIDILLFIHLSLIMIKRVLCKFFPLEFCKLINIVKTEYLTDTLICIGSIIAVCKLTNHLSTMKDATQLPDNIYWLWFINIIGVALLTKYRKSQPKLLTHFCEDIQITINKLRYVTNNIFKR